MNKPVDWDNLSRLGKLRAVIDPNDGMGYKNMLIDRVHWLAIKRQLGRTKHVLDIGCGSGRFCQRIKALGMDYAGVDSSSGMIKAAQEWNKEDEKSFFNFNGRKIPFPDVAFDAVLCARVMMHVPLTSEAPDFIKEIARVLKPGGRLVLLEEASLSNRKSGQAPGVLTEDDYRKALAAHFTVKATHKVRSSEFSKFGRKITEYPLLPYWAFRILLPALSRYELSRARNYNDDYYQRVTYYDFIICAQVNK